MTPVRLLMLQSVPAQRHPDTVPGVLTVHCCTDTAPGYQPDRNDPNRSGVIYCTACDTPLIIVRAKDGAA